MKERMTTNKSQTVQTVLSGFQRLTTWQGCLQKRLRKGTFLPFGADADTRRRKFRMSI